MIRKILENFMAAMFGCIFLLLSFTVIAIIVGLIYTFFQMGIVHMLGIVAFLGIGWVVGHYITKDME